MRKAQLRIETKITDETKQSVEGLSIAEASVRKKCVDRPAQIAYTEPVEQEMQATTSTLILEEEGITLRRTGSVDMEMVFSKGSSSRCQYRLEGLCLDLGLSTQQQSVTYQEGWPVEINLVYTLQTGADSQTQHTMTLTCIYQQEAEKKKS